MIAAAHGGASAIAGASLSTTAFRNRSFCTAKRIRRHNYLSYLRMF